MALDHGTKAMNEQILDLGPIRTSGRSRSRIVVEPLRPLTREDLSTLQEPRASRAPALKRFRDSHHRVARCFASGMKPGEVTLQTGYSASRLSILLADPSFQNLIEVYRRSVIEDNEEFHDLMIMRKVKGELVQIEFLDSILDRDTPPNPSEVRLAMDMTADANDRVGIAKNTVQTTVNLEFAGRLESARKRSGLLELKPNPTQEVDGSPSTRETSPSPADRETSTCEPIGPVGLAGPKEAVS